MEIFYHLKKVLDLNSGIGWVPGGGIRRTTIEVEGSDVERVFADYVLINL